MLLKDKEPVRKAAPQPPPPTLPEPKKEPVNHIPHPVEHVPYVERHLPKRTIAHDYINSRFSQIFQV